MTANQLASASTQTVSEASRASEVAITYLALPSLFTLADQSRWPEERTRACQVPYCAAGVGSSLVCATTGPAGPLSFEDATAGFVSAVEPVREHARQSGVSLIIEITNQLRDDLGFVSTLRDAVLVARLAGIGTCADLLWCCRERELRETVGYSLDVIELVQVSDCEVGATSMPCRVVPGDGAVPLERPIRWLLEAGYDGLVDLELVGPRIDAEGASATQSNTDAAWSLTGRESASHRHTLASACFVHYSEPARKA